MNLELPELSLVVLIGPSGSGKSTFARAHFGPTEIISSDQCRALVSDDENSLDATNDAFDVLYYIAAKRLAAGRLTVIDATNVQPDSRIPLVELARQYHCMPVAIALNLPEEICQQRNNVRTDRDMPSHVLRKQKSQMMRSLRNLEREGFRRVHILSAPEQIADACIVRQPLWNNRSSEHGPFDIIGDVHGCCDELELLLQRLGYEADQLPATPFRTYNRVYRHPHGRKAVFLGDIVDRGPRILDSYQLVRAMVEDQSALCVPGNHDIKLMRKLRGRDVRVSHGLEQSLAELAALPDDIRSEFGREMAGFIDSLVSHYLLDDGRLVVAHAGMKQTMQGRASAKVRDFALYGETTGETDEFGLPVRYNWAAEYRGDAMVVYGHTPVPQPEWLNRTINVDTGAVFGGALTALRYPELELVAVPSAATYAEPVRPLVPDAAAARTAQQENDDLLDLGDVTGKRIVDTRLLSRITIRAENATAALEVMSRFAIDPRWLLYLPPTMSPPVASSRPGMLEHPEDALGYYRSQGVEQVICEEKHMGSRAVVVLCRDEDAARRRFGVTDGTFGTCYTRTGRRFFDDEAIEQGMLSELRDAVTAGGIWEELATDWICLDCELMPWSAKAQVLLREQYAAVGAAATASFDEALRVLEMASAQGRDVSSLRTEFQERAGLMHRYREAYRQYCWPVHSLSDLRLAPFHIMATEGAVHVNRTHLWHMEMIERITSSASGLFQRTRYTTVRLGDEASEQAGISWWEELTAKGGEGMVVKPLDFIVAAKNGPLQPAVKCRGGEYLRIIYGAEYSLPRHLERVRQRNVSMKRSLAVREFSLGVEALERFVHREPLRRVHECVFGVLALESEPVDPRL